MNKADVVLQVNDLKKYFYRKRWLKKNITTQVLKGISFSICRGETVALVGESGSGKSTTARLILGLDQPTEGEITFKNLNLTKCLKKEFTNLRKDMQIVFQDPAGSVNPRMTIGKIISEPLYNFGYSREQAMERVFELVNLVGMNKSDVLKYPHQLSGGQLQRVGIARALALEPDFIVLDEPTSALDVSVQARILKLLKKLQKELQLTFLFITHDLNVVESFADRVLVMQRGEIVERGTVKEIFHSPKHPYTKLLLNSNLIAKAKDSGKSERQEDDVDHYAL